MIIKKKTVLITSGDEFKKQKKDIALILSSIYKWKDAWKTSNINEYLSFIQKILKEQIEVILILLQIKKNKSLLKMRIK